MRLSIGHGRNWKNAYVGQRRRRRGIMYFRNIAAFVSCLRARWGGTARKKRDRGKKGRRAPRDAKPDPKSFVDLPSPFYRRGAPSSDREESLNRHRSPIRDRALAIFTRRFFASADRGPARHKTCRRKLPRGCDCLITTRNQEEFALLGMEIGTIEDPREERPPGSREKPRGIK